MTDLQKIALDLVVSEGAKLGFNVSGANTDASDFELDAHWTAVFLPEFTSDDWDKAWRITTAIEANLPSQFCSIAERSGMSYYSAKTTEAPDNCFIFKAHPTFLEGSPKRRKTT